jgi:amino-acid N-acetyltransferase
MKNDNSVLTESGGKQIEEKAEIPGFTVRRATAEDVGEIFKLSNLMAKRGLMLPRSKYRIITMLAGFFVVVDNEDGIAACGAFVPLWTDMGEIMSLAVKDEYQGKGVGKMLVRSILDEGRRLKMPEIITLTYQVDFFAKMGFTVVDKDRFPRKMWRECLECPKLEECDETAMHLYL